MRTKVCAILAELMQRSILPPALFYALRMRSAPEWTSWVLPANSISGSGQQCAAAPSEYLGGRVTWCCLLLSAFEFVVLDLLTLCICHGQVAAALGISGCLLYTSPSPRDRTRSRMPSSA
eukprot:TRINITY_DN13344_c0_g1_i1.p1 TRINITY_DN13344_c0_g1~~TRINITY_DN13344_c0_g1_i1.p1  ORF type:complete len:120 (+),score=17.93 TRINITY_DN13344_c0_g1_i1:505-864(+)